MRQVIRQEVLVREVLVREALARSGALLRQVRARRRTPRRNGVCSRSALGSGLGFRVFRVFLVFRVFRVHSVLY